MTYRYRFGTVEYAVNRTDPDEQDKEVMLQLIEWTEKRLPLCHIRIANGEMMSIFRRDGMNCNEQEFRGATLGAELHAMLMDMAAYCDRRKRFDRGGPLFTLGGCWDDPPFTRAWLEWHNLFARLPWTPCQVFVNSVLNGNTLRWLRAVRSRPEKKIVVCNEFVKPVARSLGASWVRIPRPNCHDEIARIEADIEREIEPGAMVFYSAGMAGKPLAWRIWKRHEDTSVFDVGHFWDGAFGVCSRTWLLPDPNCERLNVYKSTIAPFLRGDRTW